MKVPPKANFSSPRNLHLHPTALNHGHFMREAIKLAGDGSRNGRGGPFGCIVVRKGEIVGRGQNLVTSTNDPTAHAEVTAIRHACASLKTFRLADCTLYTSCEPCPMCLAAIYWARISTVFFGNTRKDAAQIGFDDETISQQMIMPAGRRSIIMQTLLREEALVPFRDWAARPDKTCY
jgi:tRNA(Arg) A34 adenosine deaminase TadA